jgi:PAS domain S-box-containing protein
MESAFGHDLSDGQEVCLFNNVRVFDPTQYPSLEAQLQFTLNAIPALTWYSVPSGALTFVNQRCADYLGLPEDHPLRLGIGMEAEWDSHIAFLHPEDHEDSRRAWATSLRTGVAAEMTFRVRSAEGVYRWFLSRAKPLRAADGTLLYWIGLNTDADERRHAESCLSEAQRLARVGSKRSEDELKAALEEIKQLKEQLYRENLALRDEVHRASIFEEIVGTSKPLKAVLSQTAKVARTETTVLITGETGTGKELIARAVHKQSERSKRAFISVNCAAFAPTLMSSELFGHEKGAFTGAAQRRLGRFELADGGTIFLDEVGELPQDTQVALLRVLQEREFERVGGIQPIKVDVRVIAATNRDLNAAVANGSFRRDLYYRLQVFPIEIPPLRERREDIALLVEYFIDRYSRKAGKSIKRVGQKTLKLLQTYTWPGNIRELQNVVERSVVLCETETFSIDESWLPLQLNPFPVSEPKGRIELLQKLEEHARKLIEEALEASRGRVFGPSGAAVKLGIRRSTLESKIRSLKIDKTRFRRTREA